MAAKLLVLPDPKVDPWPVLWESFERSLRADGASPLTLRMYREAGGQAHAFFAGRGLPTDPAETQKSHVDDFLIRRQLLEGVQALQLVEVGLDFDPAKFR